MKNESIIRGFTCLVVLLSLALTYLLDPWWLTLAAFVGFNSIQSAFSDFCIVKYFFRKLSPEGNHHPAPTSAPSR